ncbi:dienelactone hydrolase family protein [Coraliomargarita parva]|uniref:dienelactone hydrolase family protein n=1 Tax=Coraliomargarita parva TaxID=3014050 RepID=UPI0022B324CB|nr:dienelactone hydrolase family protein [Coraliomargarita parva]
MKALLTSLTLLAAGHASAAMLQQSVPYEQDGVQFEGTLIYNLEAAEAAELPGILMVPNWMGPSENAFEKARMLAGDDYAIFVADMYGVTVRPSNAKEAGAAAGTIRTDRELMRARANKAVEVFQELAENGPIDEDRILAIGFCFGGGTVLELARSGNDDILGVVSFHGDLMSPTLSDSEDIEIPVLVLHGADDPYVPKEDVDTFINAMKAGEVDDWRLVMFSGAVHSFTNPEADSDGSRYDARTAKRAFEMMHDFADELFDD